MVPKEKLRPPSCLSPGPKVEVGRWWAHHKGTLATLGGSSLQAIQRPVLCSAEGRDEVWVGGT